MQAFEREYAQAATGGFVSCGVSAWVADILELYEGEWLTAVQMVAEIESRSGKRPSESAVRRKIYRLLHDGVIVSRRDRSPTPMAGPFNRNEYSWKR
jgi:hypothetical protein